MHYYQFNIGDYASHTSRLSPMEDLAYRRLLDLYYLNEQPLNGCATDVAREIGLVDHVSSVEYVLSKFFTFENDCYKQKRIDLEIKKYKSNAKNKSKAGKASAKARQAKAISKATPVEQTLNTKPTDEQQNTNHKPLTNNHKPVTNKQVIKEISRFAEFWNLYAKKVDSKKCEAKFKNLTKVQIDLIFEKLPAYVKSKPDKQYRKNPITWLNGECWNDEIQLSTGGSRDINEIGTDFSQPAGFRKMIFNDHGEMIGYESETKI